MSVSGRVMFYLRWPASTMNFTWQKLHPITSLNLSSLVSRALILQPGDVASPTRSPGMGADSCCSQAYPFSLSPPLKHSLPWSIALETFLGDRSAASAPPPNAAHRNLPPRRLFGDTQMWADGGQVLRSILSAARPLEVADKQTQARAMLRA